MKRLPAVIAVTLMLYVDGFRLAIGAESDARHADAPEFSAANIRRGKQFFTMHCLSCHGADGRGDTEMREFLKTPPADLSDDQWTYGDSDAVIYSVISEGRMARDMPAFSDRLNEEQVWQVIQYVQYLGGRRP